MEAIEESVCSLAEKNGVELRFDLPLEEHVVCRGGILESVVANLVGNAIKHMGRGRGTMRRGADAGGSGARYDSISRRRGLLERCAE